MTGEPDHPLRDLSKTEIAAYRRDGVVCLRGVLPDFWLDKMGRAIDATIKSPPKLVRAFSRQDEGFTGGIFLWKQEAPYHDFVYRSPVSRLAQQAMGSRRVNCFFDHLLVKEPGCELPTPWHQDLPYWPLKGTQICSIWAPFDPVTRENAGLEFIAGSQEWPQDFKPQTISKGAIDGELSELEDPPDVEGNRDQYNIVGWDMMPGDVLLFHGRILHGAGANTSPDIRRRSLATRWTGDDITWDPKPWKLRILWEDGLAPGDAMGGSLFPQILPHSLGHEGPREFTGPVAPSEKRLTEFLARQEAQAN